MRVIHPLKPIYDEHSKILILGSLPSVKSREIGFYYAHPQNRFWKVMEKVFLVELFTIEDKIKFLHDYHIAIYDVIESCEIEGSSDTKIKDVIPTNLKTMIENSQISQVFTTGKKAFELYEKYQYLDTRIKAKNLPSTSPANAAYSLDRLVEHYQVLKQYLD